MISTVAAMMMVWGISMALIQERIPGGMCPVAPATVLQ